MLNSNRIKLLLALPVVISLWLYSSTINYYFFQDDFYEILLSKVSNLNGFLNLFTFLENRSSYRPIGLQMYFFLMHTFFGLNPTLYRLVTFLFFICSYLLIINVVAKITSSKKVGLLTASLWLTSSIHFMSISWLAAAWLIIGNFFFFLTSAIFIRYYEKKTAYLYCLSIVFFLLTLGSFEFFISWPVIFFAILVLRYKVKWAHALKMISPFIIICVLYILFRIQFASLPNINEYKISIGAQTLKQIFWYFLWSFNIPEEFKKQIISHLLIFNPIFYKEFKPLIFISFGTMIVIFLTNIITPIVLCIKKQDTQTYKNIIICITWFLSAIIPVAIFPNHSFAMYLVLASIGVYMLIANLTIRFLGKLPLIIIIFLWGVSSYSTLKFYKDSFWIVDSQQFAKDFSTNIKKTFPTLPGNAIVYYPLDDKRHIQALLDQNAIKVIYNDPSIRIFYNKADLIANTSNEKTEPQLIFNFQN